MTQRVLSCTFINKSISTRVELILGPYSVPSGSLVIFVHESREENFGCFYITYWQNRYGGAQMCYLQTYREMTVSSDRMAAVVLGIVRI